MTLNHFKAILFRNSFNNVTPAHVISTVFKRSGVWINTHEIKGISDYNIPQVFKNSQCENKWVSVYGKLPCDSGVNLLQYRCVELERHLLVCNQLESLWFNQCQIELNDLKIPIEPIEHDIEVGDIYNKVNSMSIQNCRRVILVNGDEDTLHSSIQKQIWFLDVHKKWINPNIPIDSIFNEQIHMKRVIKQIKRDIITLDDCMY